MSDHLQVGVIGSSSCDGNISHIAERVGSLVAANKAVLITGGRSGVMEAASRGAKKAGGLVVGILPGASKWESNPYVDIVIPTDMGHARNAIIARSSDCLIAIAGGFGTLSEVAIALKIQRPVVVLASAWKIPGTIEVCSAEEAVNTALSLCGRDETISQ